MFKKVKRIIREWLEVETKVGGGNLDDLINNGLLLGKNVDLVNMPSFGSEPYLIKIGDDTTISFDVAFVTHDASTRVIRHLPDGDPNTGHFGPIIIGKNCFIGCRSTILAGVHIGDNSVIGAGSVVNRDIPANSVAAGVPCKVICSLDEYRAKHKDDFMYLGPMSQEEKKRKLLQVFEKDLQ